MLRNPKIRWRYWLFTLLITVNLSACQLFYSEAESRALNLVKALVLHPEDKQQAMKAANTKQENQLDRLLAPLSTQIAVNYLQASHRQGKKLKFKIVSIKHADTRHYLVKIKVERARSNYQRPDIVFFDVSLVKDKQTGWQVIQLRAPART